MTEKGIKLPKEGRKKLNSEEEEKSFLKKGLSPGKELPLIHIKLKSLLLRSQNFLVLDLVTKKGPVEKNQAPEEETIVDLLILRTN